MCSFSLSGHWPFMGFDFVFLIIIRDTAKYPPLMKTNKASNSLNSLTQAFLG